MQEKSFKFVHYDCELARERFCNPYRLYADGMEIKQTRKPSLDKKHNFLDVFIDFMKLRAYLTSTP